MKTIDEKRKQWLDTHLKPYLENPSNRAMNGEVCCYRTPDGRKCIIGQDIPDKKYIPIMDDITNSSISCNDYVVDVIPKSTKDLGMDFLKDCQNLHDMSSHWNAEGLSKQGQECYERIIYKYCQP